MLSFFISKVNYAIYRKKIQTKNKINTHILLGNMHCYLVYIFDNRFLLYIHIYFLQKWNHYYYFTAFFVYISVCPKHLFMSINVLL